METETGCFDQMEKPFVKRGRLEILYEMLSVARNPVGKTRIAYGCNLSHDIVERHLEHAIDHGMLAEFRRHGRQIF